MGSTYSIFQYVTIHMSLGKHFAKLYIPYTAQKMKFSIKDFFIANFQMSVPFLVWGGRLLKPVRPLIFFNCEEGRSF